MIRGASVFRRSRLVDMNSSVPASREISPTHFPGIDGSYENFEKLPPSAGHKCCDGTPPPLLERNVVRKNGGVFIYFWVLLVVFLAPQAVPRFLRRGLFRFCVVSARDSELRFSKSPIDLRMFRTYIIYTQLLLGNVSCLPYILVGKYHYFSLISKTKRRQPMQPPIQPYLLCCRPLWLGMQRRCTTAQNTWEVRRGKCPTGRGKAKLR